MTPEITIPETTLAAMTIAQTIAAMAAETPAEISAALAIPTEAASSTDGMTSTEAVSPIPLAPAVLWRVMAVTEMAKPETALSDGDAMDLWPYRNRTVALLKRYARASVEVGRLPSLLGREFFRSRITSYSTMSFENIVIFVLDVEMALERLNRLQGQLIAMCVLEEYSFPEAARLVPCPLRTVERELPEALDRLSRLFLDGDLIRGLPVGTRGEQSWGNADIR